MRYKGIKEKIISRYDSFSKNQKSIADYFIKNLDTIPFMSVLEISNFTSTSVATVVRFAQRIGFKGFLELREEISRELQSHLVNNEIFPLIDNEKFPDDTLTFVANQDIRNINDTINLMERKNLQKGIDLILKSERVYTMGLGISYLLAEILSYQFCQVGIDAKIVSHNYSSFMEQVIYMNRKDVLIAFSFPPYSKETVEALNYAKRKGIKTISISNKQASPISFHSDISFVVSSQNMIYTNSFAAISVIINAITTECAIKNKKNVRAINKEMNKIVDEQNILL